MKILILGGLGFVGSSLAEKLYKKHDVTILTQTLNKITNIWNFKDKVTIIEKDLMSISEEDVEQSLTRYRRWDESPQDGENFYQIKAEMQAVMQNDFGVFRTGDFMSEGLNKLDTLQERLNNATLTDKSHVFNTARIEALELDNLMGTARATALSALTRTESRGAHSREDFKDRDDKNWIKHSVYYEDNNQIQFRPVNINPKYVEAFEPKERVY